MTNKSFQVSAIKRLLKQKGIDPDLIDVDAMVDSTLSLQENARIIMEDVKLMQEMGNLAPETVSDTKITNFLKAVEIFQRKSWNRQLMDSKRQARITFTKSKLSNENFKTWHENTNRYDIEGVDSKYG
jgi:hypothetical protein